MHYAVVNPLKTVFLWSLLLVLAACSTTATPTETDNRFEYVASLEVTAGETEASLEAQYGGQIVVLDAEAGFAVLGFTKEEAQLTTLATDSNIDVFDAPELEMGGHSSWAGGFSSWAGGWSAWAGGWSAWAGGFSAWAGGMPDTPKENRKKLSHVVRMNHGQAIATTFGDDIVVAVIDTGVDITHPMLEGRLTHSNTWYDFRGNDSMPKEGGKSGNSGYGHGTAVAGAILQVAPQAKIMPIRVLGAQGKGDTDDVIKAIYHAVNKGADVINLSLGATKNIKALQDAVAYATNRGVYVVTSAGNSGSDMTYPAATAKTISNHSYLLSVGSVNDNGNLSGFSSRGSNLEFLAPGEQVHSAGPDGKKFHASGTSFAAPIVAGTLAIGLSELESRGRNASYAADRLQSSANPTNCGGSTCYLIDINNYIASLPGYSKKNVLLVADTSLNASDTAVKTHLENLGYNVTVRDDGSVSTSDANGKALIIVSSTVSTRNVNNMFRDVTVPFITWEQGILDDMRMASSKGHNTTAIKDIKILDDAHPLAAGLSGKISIYDNAQGFVWSVPSSSATVVAQTTLSNPQTVIFGYEKGASMVGMKAPARRVGLFAHDNSFASNNLANNGLHLLEAAITWAVSGN